MPAMTLMMGLGGERSSQRCVKVRRKKKKQDPSSRPNQPYNPIPTRRERRNKKMNTRISPFRCLVPEEELKRKRRKNPSRPKVAALWLCAPCFQRFNKPSSSRSLGVAYPSMGRKGTSVMSLASSPAEQVPRLPCRVRSIAPSEPSLALEPPLLLAPAGTGTRGQRMTS